MQDHKVILYRGYAYSSVTWPGPTVAAQTAQSDPTHTAGNTGWFNLLDVKKVPFSGQFLVLNMPGPFTPSGASGTATLVLTVTHSDNGSSAIANLSHVSRPVIFTAATGPVATITTPTVQSGITQYNLFYRLPEVRHQYIQVAWATTLATITTMDYGPVTIALEEVFDSEAPNSIDIG